MAGSLTVISIGAALVSVLAVSIFGAAAAEFSGAPTAISQRWPGCPCGGFIPGAVTTGCAEAAGGCNNFGVPPVGAAVGVILNDWLPEAWFGLMVIAGWLVILAAEFSGAPTAISQRCPGCPCAGFIPGATAVGCTVVAPGVAVIVGAAVGVICATGSFDAAASGAAVVGVSDAVCGSRSFLQAPSTNAIDRRPKSDFAFMWFGLSKPKYS